MALLLYLIDTLIKLSLIILALCIILRFFAKLTSAWCKSNVYLGGKTALITGGSSGIGYQTALGLAARGCRVIIAHKNKVSNLKENIIEKTGNHNIVIKYFDMCSLESIRELAKDINKTEERLDILINNAGTADSSNDYTEDGLLQIMQINHFGGFLLTHLLLGLLKQSAPSRIIFISSLLAYTNNLTPENLGKPPITKSHLLTQIVSYGNTKLCNIISANVFSKRLEGTGVTVNSLHPGVVNTQIFQKIQSTQFLQTVLYRFILKYFGKTPQEGAQTILHVAVSKELQTVSGKYYLDGEIFPQPSKAADEEFCEKIWKASEDYVKLTPKERLFFR